MLATGSLSILGRTVTVAPDTYLYIEPTKTLEGTAPVWTQGHLQLVAADSAASCSEGGTLGLKSFAATAAEKAAAEQAAKEEKHQAETVYAGQQEKIAARLEEEPQSRQTVPARTAVRDEKAGEVNDDAVTFAN
ncbi:hypothetical protein [Selenomonas montiformis]|uniref:hypothetical protein n=1 Tax=Selenomonas montiformis TaxID=2652285 RepID=UPI0039F63FEA